MTMGNASTSHAPIATIRVIDRDHCVLSRAGWPRLRMPLDAGLQHDERLIVTTDDGEVIAARVRIDSSGVPWAEAHADLDQATRILTVRRPVLQ